MKSNRRGFLRGAGVCIALPFLPSLIRKAGAQSEEAKRLVVVHLPNGTLQRLDDVDPSETILGEYAGVAEYQTIVKRMDNSALKNAQSRRGYYTAHAGGLVTMYGGRTIGGAGDEGQTFDQRIAALEAYAGDAVPTLAINCFRKQNPQSGVAPQSFNNISWRGPGDAVNPFQDPRQLFERVFADRSVEPDPALMERRRRRGLYLDAVLGEIRDMRPRLGRDDHRRLDEYLTGVEELDRRSNALSEDLGPVCSSEAPDGIDGLDLTRIQGATYERVVDLMQELSLRALQCGLTKVVTFSHCGAANGSEILNAVDTSDFEGVNHSWHPLSHWNSPYGTLSSDTALNRRDLGRLLRWHHAKIARFVERLTTTMGPGGVPLIDDTVVTAGSHISVGASHRASNLYQLLFSGAEFFNRGTTIDAGNQPPSHLWASFARAYGAPGAIGDSNGEVQGVFS